LQAIESAEQKKTEKAKQNAILRAADRIEKAKVEFLHGDSLGLEGQIIFTKNLLNQYANSMIGSSTPPKPLDLLRSLASLKSKQIVSDSFVILDTETTGLDENAQVVEVAVIDYEGNILLDTLVKPTESIPPRATEIHGISNQDVTNAPTFAEVWQEQLQPILMDKTVCIWNAAFDLRVIHSSLFEYDLPPHDIQKVSCIMKLYADFNGVWNPARKQKTWQKLSVAAEQCGISLPSNLHRAGADAELTRRVFNYIANHPE
jgi:DNA polymerase-3 subunit epsilon